MKRPTFAKEWHDHATVFGFSGEGLRYIEQAKGELGMLTALVRLSRDFGEGLHVKVKIATWQSSVKGPSCLSVTIHHNHHVGVQRDSVTWEPSNCSWAPVRPPKFHGQTQPRATACWGGFSRDHLGRLWVGPFPSSAWDRSQVPRRSQKENQGDPNESTCTGEVGTGVRWRCAKEDGQAKQGP